jgi:hypothetical protein
MNLADIAKCKMGKNLRGQKLQGALKVLKGGLQSVQPDLKTAYLRLQLMNSSLIPGLLKNYSSDFLAEYCAEIFIFPASPEEAKIQLLADRVISLQYSEKRLNVILLKAKLEIKKAYNALMRDGGGWSSLKSNSDKRKTAVLAWYQENKSCLSYLTENMLNNQILYRGGGGQDKRDFQVRLLLEIIKENGNKEIAFRKVHDDYFKSFKGPIQPLRVEDL